MKKRQTLLRANCITPFSFPKDHGQHRDFRTEWWYLSGRLRSNDGTDWAYHFTIFRRAFEKWSHLGLVGLAISLKSIRNIAPFKRAFARMLENQADRRIPVDGYVGHLSITNIGEKDFVFFERGGTSVFSEAGAKDDRLDVWVKGWRLWEGDGVLHLLAKRDDFAVDIELLALKPPILNGNQGLSIKGLNPGEASFHYSMASLQTKGTLKWRGNIHQVIGSSFMDREFGTSILPRSVKGWDWFGLILNNDHELMISLVHDSDGSMTGLSSGTLVFPDGSSQCFKQTDLRVEVVELWTSLATGARYPTHWILTVEALNVELEIHALMQDHELVSATSTTINYWEGPVTVSGSMSGQPVGGHGHVELVGYAESVGGKF